MSSRWIAAWRVGALLAVAGIAVVNVVFTAQKVPPLPMEAPVSVADPLVQQERRFAGVRASVQALGIRGTVGYFGELSTADDDYYYAQFVLAPLVLDFNPAPYEWAVANLPASSPGARLPATWALVKNFGDGVLLLRRSAP
jgi:hypothetical protein